MPHRKLLGNRWFYQNILLFSRMSEILLAQRQSALIPAAVASPCIANSDVSQVMKFTFIAPAAFEILRYRVVEIIVSDETPITG